MSDIFREITPLTPQDCFMVFDRKKTGFDFPLHIHEEFELNFIEGATGAMRVVGENTDIVQPQELVLIGSNLPHGWFTHECTNTDIHEITIQFHRDLFEDNFLKRNQLNFIKSLLERSEQGITFSPETINFIKPRLIELKKRQGFDSVLELLSILHDLSVSRNMRTITSTPVNGENINYFSQKIKKAFDYMRANYDKKISLNEIAEVVNMTPVGFCSFIKKRTGRNFVDLLIDIRLGHASRLLIDTTLTIAEISLKSGFNNLANFNRVFKKKYSITPKEFRENYSGKRTFV